MDYEKKIREYMVSSKVDQLYKSMLINLFPELAESEDEKIRKWLIRTLKALNTSGVEIDGAYDMMLPAIAYLEKQGEQKPLDIEIPFGAKDSELIEETYHIPDGYHAEINSNTVVIKKDEQKPVEWSEEDEKLYQSALWHIKNSCGNQGKTSGEYEVYHFVKSLKDRIQPQPKQEWSEED